MRRDSGGAMKQEKHGSETRPRDNKAAVIMLVVLLVLVGIVVWTLITRTTRANGQQGAVLLDSTKTPAMVDLANFYSGLDNGDSWLEITDTIGWPVDCLKEISITAGGNQQVCMWHSDEASVIVVLLNDNVVSKTKVGF
jgi:hypothetical protein